MKIIMVLLSGAYDRPSPLREDRTPLDVAHTPALDHLAATGSAGMFDPIGPGVPVDPYMALYLLLGGKGRDYPGKGYYLALEQGIDTTVYDTFVECLFARVRSVCRNLHVEKVTPLLGDDIYSKMALSLDDIEAGGFHFRFKYLGRGRGVAYTRGGSRFVSFSLPPSDGAPVNRVYSTLSERYGSIDPRAREKSENFANALNLFMARSHEILDGMNLTNLRRAAGITYANFLLTASSGSKERGSALHPVLKPVFISQDPIAAHIFSDFGFKCAGEWGSEGEGVLAGIEGFIKDGGESKMAVIYSSRSREISEVGQFDAKKSCLEKLDKLVGEVSRIAGRNAVMVISSDSYSLVSREGRYCGDAIPFVLHGPGVPGNGQGHFREADLMRGGQGRITASSFMDILLSYTNQIGCYFLGDVENMLYSPGSDQYIYRPSDFPKTI
ncbi:MAG: hypothetical protein CVV64_05090 [Candidatus Wallbacteria bacterium HGW-Wallbacteria-1]|jgi:2,3-bisphosphoglycerate-independent phosphoglycerate mutase|uniref:Metalloenzyme domain-containing protein n=1 Tax=Candidatus Wallbacteria bacterium HGW-Wallbacteria-1 TaxID=2013854 RepID=A0A2N1PS34_9BACT|nr:MAG: hypothetical protein CVV64_05090 [Candidatus Wallbacteria bacterium HGW-Wallbacteria-1]